MLKYSVAGMSSGQRALWFHGNMTSCIKKNNHFKDGRERWKKRLVMVIIAAIVQLITESFVAVPQHEMKL